MIFPWFMERSSVIGRASKLKGKKGNEKDQEDKDPSSTFCHRGVIPDALTEIQIIYTHKSFCCNSVSSIPHKNKTDNPHGFSLRQWELQVNKKQMLNRLICRDCMVSIWIKANHLECHWTQIHKFNILLSAVPTVGLLVPGRTLGWAIILYSF